MWHCAAMQCAVAVVTTLAAGAPAPDVLATPPGFTPRPKVVDETPRRLLGPGTFQRVPRRRLQPEGSKPARDLYVVEEGGHRFAYEYAGRSAAGQQILNVDLERSVAAVACEGLPSRGSAEGRLRLLWHAGATPGVGSNSTRARLRSGDVVAGGKAWGCWEPGVGFLVEVLHVEDLGAATEPVTSMVVRPTSPFRVFRDLHVGFEWTRAERRLTNSWDFAPSVPFLGFNIGEDQVVERQHIDVGPLRCENCYIALQPVVKFSLQTSSEGNVKKVSMEIRGDLNVSANLKANPSILDALSLNSWHRVYEFQGPDLVALGAGALAVASSGGWLAPAAPVILPLFDELTDSLDIELLPVMGLDHFVGTTQDMVVNGQISLNVKTGSEGNVFSATWDSVNGFTTTASLDVVPTVTFTSSQQSHSVSLGIRSCIELQLSSYDFQLTAVSACPEVSAFMDMPGADVEVQLPSSVQATTGNDAQLCIEFLSFTTDGGLDPLQDHAYGRACIMGKCEDTTAKTFPFLSNTVEWSDGPLCLPVRSAALRDSAVSLSVKEANNIFYDNPYTDPHLIKLTSEECPDLSSAGGCTKDISLTPSAICASMLNPCTMATLSVRFTMAALRRRAEALHCSGLAVATGFGVHADFAGVSFPTAFSTNGGEMVVEPANAPSSRPDEPDFFCDEPAEVYDFASSARPGGPGGPGSRRWLGSAALIGCALALPALP